MKQTVIIFRLGSLGDTIVALPCFNKIAECFPESRRLVLTNVPIANNAAPLLSVLGLEGEIVDGAISYPIGLRSPRGIIRLLRLLRQQNADTLVYLTPNRGRGAAWRDWLFFKLAGFKNIIGFPHTRDLLENRIDPETGLEEREAERLARCLSDLAPIDLSSQEAWDLHLNDAELAAGAAAVAPFEGRPFLALNMGGKAAQNDWGEDNWLTLFKSLRSDFGHLGLFAVGAEVDVKRANALFEHWPTSCINGCGKLTPRESAVALSHATAFIGHDSGPLHLTATTGIPVLGLFSDLNKPKKWHPIGKSVTVIHNMQGIRAITVSEVEQAMRDMLQNVPKAAGQT